MSGAPEARPRGAQPFVPMLLLALAVVAWLAAQTWAQWADREQLAAAAAAIEPQAQNATKLRASLDAVATQTAKLAAEGNPTARVIVEELRKRGVTINPNGAKTP